MLRHLFIWLLIVIFAHIANVFLWVLSFIWAIVSSIRHWNLYIFIYFLVRDAFTLDQRGNCAYSAPLNDLGIKDKTKTIHGSPDKTISHIIGVGFSEKNLQALHLAIKKGLDTVDKNHTYNARMSNQYTLAKFEKLTLKKK